jgi:hypothetical protein
MTEKIPEKPLNPPMDMDTDMEAEFRSSICLTDHESTLPEKPLNPPVSKDMEAKFRSQSNELQ